MPPVTISVDTRSKVAAAYNAAADRYDSVANSFWTRFGEALVDRIGLRPGQRVLDVCCGTGAASLAAARWVGPRGYVLGIDLAEELLLRAQRKAAVHRYGHVKFRVADMLELSGAELPFDAVICAFGLHYADDMVGAARELWRLTRPGGTLAITTWGPWLFEPMNTIFWSAVAGVRPDLGNDKERLQQVNSEAGLRDVLAAAAIHNVSVETETSTHPLHGPGDWWDIVMGSEYRGIVEQLTRDERDQVCGDCAATFRAMAVADIETNVVYAIARK